MSVENNSGFIVEAWHIVVAFIGFALTWAWKFVTGDIRNLRNTTVTKDDFRQYAEAAQKQRDELREAVINLYKGQGDLKDEVHAMENRVVAAIHETRK